MDYFKKLLGLLQIEREEDRLSYKKLTENTSVSERRGEGLAWYPIAIRGTEMGRGDYLTVELERTTHQDIAHQFRSGMPAVLFSNHDPKEDRVEGTISYQNGNRLKIALRNEELPDWSRDGKLGIELMFDDNSYDEMNAALKKAEKDLENPARLPLMRVLLGEKEPSYHPNPINYHFKGLNESQENAAQKILMANELSIVHGPPGTGKTTTLIQAITALAATGSEKILVVAPSNTAVDLLSEKLSEEGLHVVRVGNPAKVSQRLSALTLDHKMTAHPRTKEIKALKKQANEFRNMAHKYKRNFGKAEREQRKALFDEAHRIIKEVGRTEQYIIDDLLSKAQVITATLVGSNHYTVRELNYDTLVIDEAGQALEPACWIPILKANRVVLAGDYCQLPPTIKSNQAAQQGLSLTLLEKLAETYPNHVTLLDTQYRMNQAIMGYSSQVFYENRLIAHNSVANWTLLGEKKALAFIDTAGCGFDEKLEGTSSTNPEEASFAIRYLSHLVSEMETRPGYTAENFPSIGIISPYKQQIELLKTQVDSSPVFRSYGGTVQVNTIDSFQGQERDIILISLTRSNIEGNIGFLSDIRRMNVAMTRARKKLIVIGDSATLGSLPFYADFIDYTQNCEGYFSAWEFMDV
ncbi:AAA domain-containing protein [Dyadobacter tibetensis]|uniref:AAA domain-containing protein n=1 Tax=Dyadobacter tibetensis TaxID=1211851 RepID=UPI00046F71CE|nr:AAA domain-containing protein [Dyadobacter tibetensis]